MQAVFKNAICIVILAIIIYLFYVMFNPPKIKPLYMKKNATVTSNPNIYINADINENCFGENEPILDRLPLVEENTHIIPANEIVTMNYKDCNALKDSVEKELYTSDLPLFREMGPTNLVPLNVNDTTHRRVNFY